MRELPIKSIAVCGLGRIGWLHAECVRSCGFHLAAVCDENPDVALSASEQWQVPVFTDWRMMLREIRADTVVIATPSHLHFEMTVSALQEGFHVLLEKPAASNASEVIKMMEEAGRSGRLLTVCQTLRYQPDTVILKKMIETGFAGRLDHISLRRNTGLNRREDWQIWRKFNGGVLSNMGVHLVDSMLHVCGARQPRAVFASMRTMINKGDTEDAVNVTLDFEGGLFAEIEIYRGLLDKPIWELYGDRGTAILEGPLPQGRLRSMKVDQPEQAEAVDFDKVPTNLEAFYRDLQGQLNLGQPPAVSMESVLSQMRVVDAIRESAVRKDVVRLLSEEDLVLA